MATDTWRERSKGSQPEGAPLTVFPLARALFRFVRLPAVRHAEYLAVGSGSMGRPWLVTVWAGLGAPAHQLPGGRVQVVEVAVPLTCSR